MFFKQQLLLFVIILIVLLTLVAKDNSDTTHENKDKAKHENIKAHKKEKTLNYEWSKETPEEVTWDEAKSYCENLDEKNHTDWRLPTISELRTLIKNCPATEPGGKCKVSDNCLTGSCWSNACKECVNKNRIYKNCESNWFFCLIDSPDTLGKHSVLGHKGWFWSSSQHMGADKVMWFVSFNGGFIAYAPTNPKLKVLCVRKTE